MISINKLLVKKITRNQIDQRFHHDPELNSMNLLRLHHVLIMILSRSPICPNIPTMKPIAIESLSERKSRTSTFANIIAKYRKYKSKNCSFPTLFRTDTWKQFMFT